MSQVTVTQPSQGKTIGVVGDVYRLLATGNETDGRYTTLEATVPPGGGPPPHVHSREDETFYVVEGEITFWIGDERVVAKPGTFVHMPIGQPHAFKNETERAAKMLISFAPAGLEGYFLEVGQPLEGELPPKPTQVEIEKLMAVAPRYGVEITAPSS